MMYIWLESGMEISVDLVPVLTFPYQNLSFYKDIWINIHNPDWLNSHTEEYKNKIVPYLTQNFFAVPKQIQEDKTRVYENVRILGDKKHLYSEPKIDWTDSSIIQSYYDICWSLDFRELETEIIKNKNCASKVVKLLKFFRNCNTICEATFKSYYLKTIVLNMIKGTLI